ncbi:MAG: hypothetical protein KF805_07800 [Phycisphaeraceae bacterium]|nr:hypothetical protein [Phycisphaeraceae bacterium]
MYEKLTQRAPSTSVSGTNTRSRLFAYDKLDRLLGVKTGALDTSSTLYTVGESDAYPSVRRELWNLDLMGNWAGVGGMASGPSSDPCAWPTVPGGGGPGGTTTIEPPAGGTVGLSMWFDTEYGHEVSFDGTPPPPPPSTGVAEVFERHHPADAPTESESKDQLPSEWMTNLHANSVRVIEETDPLNPLPLGPDGKRLSDEGYTAHRADPNGNTVFDGEYFY